ncbi:hypothetical protein JL475_32130 [Streptomyces sp. M2CJ-2]|nr:hypothetical protein [Streptomyces sp. M2CJ-2]MBL3670542.1 hypothetical protein [Streptomyces sp. M2CJ-2]
MIQVAILMRASARVPKVCRWTYSTLSTLLNASLTALIILTVEARSDSAHGPGHAQPAAGPLGLPGAVFAAPVGVHDHAAHVAAAGGRGHVQGRDDQVGVMTGGHRVAEQPTGEQIDDRRQVQLPPPVSISVMSPARTRSGSSAVKSRRTKSGAADRLPGRSLPGLGSDRRTGFPPEPGG